MNKKYFFLTKRSWDSGAAFAPEQLEMSLISWNPCFSEVIQDKYTRNDYTVGNNEGF